MTDNTITLLLIFANMGLWFYIGYLVGTNVERRKKLRDFTHRN